MSTNSLEIWRAFELYEAAGCLRYSTVTVCNIAFAAGAMLLLIAVQNDTSKTHSKELIEKVRDHITFLGKMPWPASKVAQEILRRLKEEWAVHVDASPDSSAAPNETMQALQNPQSELVRLLTSMGWVAPTSTSTQIASDHLTPTTMPLQTVNMNDLQDTLMSAAPPFTLPFPTLGQGSGHGSTLPLLDQTMLTSPDFTGQQFPNFDQDHMQDVHNDRELRVRVTLLSVG